MNAAFYLISFFTIFASILAVSLRNLIHCALAAALSFSGVAMLFFLLKAEFVGVIQILIYIGAVATLILFTIMLTRNLFDKLHYIGQRRKWTYGILTAAFIFIILTISILSQTNLPQIVTQKTKIGVFEIGKELLTTFILPFEVVSLLLTAAMMGGIVIALGDYKEES